EGPDGEECFPGQGLEICDLVYVSCEELCVDESLIDPNFICPGFQFPVCGCDGITYQNACIARWHHGVTTWTLGECDVFEIQIPVENDTPFYMTNPVENELRLGWKGKQLTEILIYNLHGQMIQRTLTDHDEDGFTQLDVSTLPPGLYILQVSDSEGNVRTEKFVKT
ncbi:MAG: T9SS C-terminal target domain-containing protein, partial [Bacteroidetes bacterium]